MMMEAISVENGSVNFVVESGQDMKQLAARIASHVKSCQASSGIVIFLCGNLGAGKTTFAQGFIKACGFDGIVKSPTYTLVEPYRFDGDKMCYHFDLYRLTDDEESAGEELEHTGARDYFDTDSICLVEWPEKAEMFLPQPDIRCTFKAHERGREACLVPVSDKGKAIMLQFTSDISL